MVKVIMGAKGSGKTKLLVDMVNFAEQNEPGNVVCLEYARDLGYEIRTGVRLIDVAQYELSGYCALKGFVCGLYAGNYDISHIFIDSLFKISKSDSIEECEEFLEWASKFSSDNGVKLTVMISANIEDATDTIKSYF